MGRHRSDPGGAGRILVTGSAVLALLGLIVFGIFALIGSLNPDDAVVAGVADATVDPSAGGDPPRPSDPPDTVPTVYLECLAAVCPVFLRVPGGDVLVDRDLTRGEVATYYEPKIDVVLSDAASVRVLVNGKPREPGEKGERQTFTAVRPTPSPSPGGD